MLDCGLRRGETVPIGWQDVKGGLLQISKSVEYKSDCNQPTLKDTKTAAGVRFVPLPDQLAAMLDKKSRYFFSPEGRPNAYRYRPAADVGELPPRL